MSDTRFSIANTEDGTVAALTGLTWEDALQALGKSPDADIDYALASMGHKRSYRFHNANGQIMELSREA